MATLVSLASRFALFAILFACFLPSMCALNCFAEKCLV
jgi:hypothetical protein